MRSVIIGEPIDLVTSTRKISTDKIGLIISRRLRRAIAAMTNKADYMRYMVNRVVYKIDTVKH